MSKVIDCKAARPHWRGIRDLVEYERFMGAHVEVFESSGWWIRDFVIKGDEPAVSRIWRALDDFQTAREKS